MQDTFLKYRIWEKRSRTLVKDGSNISRYGNSSQNHGSKKTRINIEEMFHAS